MASESISEADLAAILEAGQHPDEAHGALMRAGGIFGLVSALREAYREADEAQHGRQHAAGMLAEARATLGQLGDRMDKFTFQELAASLDDAPFDPETGNTLGDTNEALRAERDEARAALAAIEAAMVTRWGVENSDGLVRYGMAAREQAQQYARAWNASHPREGWHVVTWREYRTNPVEVES